MSDDARFDTRARAWIADGPSRAPQRAIEDALRRIEAVEQRQSPWWQPGAYRPTGVRQSRLQLAGAVAAVAVAVAVAVGLPGLKIGPNLVGDTPPPAGTPTAAPTPSGSAVPAPSPIDTSAWVTATSELYGYSLRHPAEWGAGISGTFWTIERFRNRLGAGGLGDDLFAAPDSGAYPRLHVFSVPSEPGSTLRSFSAEVGDAGGVYLSCFPTAVDAGGGATEETSIDGQPGLVVRPTCGAPWAIAFVAAGGRYYAFHVEDRRDYPDSLMFRAILGTVVLNPDDAQAPPAAPPSASP